MHASFVCICRPLDRNLCIFGVLYGVCFGVPYICGVLLIFFFPFYRELLVLPALSRRE